MKRTVHGARFGMVAVLVCAGMLAGCSKDQAAAATTLEPASKAGADPFTDSVSVGPTAEFPGNVQAINASVRKDLKTDPDTGMRVAKGSTAGLYGGSGEAQVCDPDKLVAFLKRSPAKAKAWAGVIGIRQSGIESFVRSLTPVVLTSDTLVMNHGFRDAKATAKRSVLQAGTAVMVDRAGTPRVKCNCGNPLGRASGGGLDQVEGAAWASFEPSEVITVVPAPTGGTLTVTDTSTGEPVEVPVGGSTPSPKPKVPPAEEIPDVSWEVATDDENGSSTAYGATIDGAVISDIAEDAASALRPDDERLYGFDALVVTANAPDGIGREYFTQDVGWSGGSTTSVGFRVEGYLSTPDPGPIVAVGSRGSDDAEEPVIASQPMMSNGGPGSWVEAEVPGAAGRSGRVGAVTYVDGAVHAVVVYDAPEGGNARDLALISSTDGRTWKQDGPLLRAGGDSVALAATDEGLVLGAVPADDGGGDHRIVEPITINPGAKNAEPIAGTPFADTPAVDIDGPDGGVGVGLVAGAGRDVFISRTGRTWKKVDTVDHPITAVSAEIAAPVPGSTTASATTTVPSPSASDHPCNVGDILGFKLDDGEGLEFLDCAGDFAAVGTYDLASGDSLTPGFLIWNSAQGGWEVTASSPTSPYCTGTVVPESVRPIACGAG